MPGEKISTMNSTGDSQGRKGVESGRKRAAEWQSRRRWRRVKGSRSVKKKRKTARGVHAAWNEARRDCAHTHVHTHTHAHIHTHTCTQAHGCTRQRESGSNGEALADERNREEERRGETEVIDILSPVQQAHAPQHGLGSRERRGTLNQGGV